MSNWHQLERTDVLHQLSSNLRLGLSQSEVCRRQERYGLNQLPEKASKNPWLILWEQLIAPLVILLWVAIAISLILGDYKEAIVILIIVILNALLGFSQEYRAEQAMVALKNLAVPSVRVRREGNWQTVRAVELVVGDIVLLEAGNVVPADIRLLEIANLRIQESILTGEAEPVNKHPDRLVGDLPLGDRYNMAYMGTQVTYGRGQGIVVATGIDTELGQIAALLHQVNSQLTPLQRHLQKLGQDLVAAAIGLVIVIWGLGLWQGQGIKLMFLTAVSMAVAAVPESLPAVVTIALALGSQRMLKRGALIRKLPAVETLGSVTVICTDKTGTLTENCMTVNVIDVIGRRLNLTSYLTPTSPGFDSRVKQPSLLEAQPQIALLLAGSALCNNASLEADSSPSYHFHVVGDPTEGALVMAAESLGLSKVELEQSFPRVAEMPFDSQRKCMTTVHQIPSSPANLSPILQIPWQWHHNLGAMPYLAFTKGAVDQLLDLCTEIWVNTQAEPLTEVWKDWIQDTNNELAAEGTRVLGIAFRPHLSSHQDDEAKNLEKDLIFLGLLGMSDPIRPEVKEAVETCITAGIRPVMITGDHPLTARHIAAELGLTVDGHILTGQDLSYLSAEELVKKVYQTSVCARVTPEQKLQIVKAWQQLGEIVAMTGDGVNDAPALKKADIGIAMGMTGTDVAKEAADMALLDDNFATIVTAVKEGRTIYDNVRKFIFYMLSSNSGEIWVMLVGFCLGMPLPLLPLQILWINLTTDGLPALALGVEPPERHIMHRPPYPPTANIFSRGMGWRIIWVGGLMGLVSLGTGYWYWLNDHDSWQTMLFSILTLSQMGNALAIRSEKHSLFQIGLLSNKPLLASVILTLGLQLMVIYLPFLQELFQTIALSGTDLLLCLGLSTIVFWGVELEKWSLRRRRGRKIKH